MSFVSAVTNLVWYEIFEDGGPVLGIVTLQQVIDMCNLTILDWQQRTCSIALIQTQQVAANQNDYTYPDALMRVDQAFLGGLLLEPTTVQALQNGPRNWRTTTGLPTRYHLDELPLKTVDVVPVPNYSGIAFTPPQTGSFNITVSAVTYTPAQHMDLTLVGPQLPATVTATTDNIGFGSPTSPTALLSQDFVLAYIEHGVMARVYAGDNELKSDAMAQWHTQEFEEGIAIVQAMMGEWG